jgi:acyl dehydratase
MIGYFEDFATGSVEQSHPRVIEATDLDRFAELTGDPARMHLEDGLGGSLYDRRVAHGAFVFSLAIGLSAQMGSVRETLLALYRVDRLRFVAPVFVGDTITVSKRVLEKKPAGKGRGLVIFGSRVTNQDGRLVVEYCDQLLILRRGG